MSSLILIAEDEESLRTILVHSLKKLGYSVMGAADGQIAWDILQNNKVELIISDWMMPNMTGIELLRKKTADERFADIPFLMLTARNDEHDLTEAFRDGVHDYLSKPYKLQELLMRSKRLISEYEIKLKLKEKSNRDALTGFYNRGRFDEDFERELHRCQRYGNNLSMVMIDIDKFKNVNDIYGHVIGDCVIKEMCKRMSSLFRNSDMLYRLGGEEFIALLPETTLKGATEVGNRLLEITRSQPFECDGNTLPITISCGVAQYLQKETINDFLERLDAALYKAKETGRNKVVCATN